MPPTRPGAAWRSLLDAADARPLDGRGPRAGPDAERMDSLDVQPGAAAGDDEPAQRRAALPPRCSPRCSISACCGRPPGQQGRHRRRLRLHGLAGHAARRRRAQARCAASGAIARDEHAAGWERVGEAMKRGHEAGPTGARRSSLRPPAIAGITAGPGRGPGMTLETARAVVRARRRPRARARRLARRRLVHRRRHRLRVSQLRHVVLRGAMIVTTRTGGIESRRPRAAGSWSRRSPGSAAEWAHADRAPRPDPPGRGGGLVL